MERTGHVGVGVGDECDGHRGAGHFARCIERSQSQRGSFSRFLSIAIAIAIAIAISIVRKLGTIRRNGNRCALRWMGKAFRSRPVASRKNAERRTPAAWSRPAFCVVALACRFDSKRSTVFLNRKMMGDSRCESDRRPQSQPKPVVPPPELSQMIRMIVRQWLGQL